jgi:hypothetical protein
MRKIIGQHGWPGKAVVGPAGEQAAWLLIQHADHDQTFQRDCLSLLEKTSKEDPSVSSFFAYLTDRVRVHQGLPQIYGTQFRGDLLPFTIEDEGRVDERRKQAGLQPLAQYLDQVRHSWTEQSSYSQVAAETKHLLSQLPSSETYNAYVGQMKRLLNRTDNA